MFVLMFVFVSASYAQTYQKPREQEIFHYAFQKGDNPWKVLRGNYGYANEGLVDSFLAENKITSPKKIKIGTVVILHKNLIDMEALKVVLQKNVANHYESGINLLEAVNEDLSRKVTAYETAIQLYNQLLELSLTSLERQKKTFGRLLAFCFLISLVIGTLAGGHIVNIKARNKYAEATQELRENNEKKVNSLNKLNGLLQNECAVLIKKIREDGEKRINNLIGGISLLQREKLRLAKAFGEAKRKELEYAEKIKFFEARQPGKTVALNVGNNKYPVTIVGWNLIDWYKDKISPLGRKYGKELVFACTECGKVLSTQYGVRVHWEDSHSDEKKNTLLAEDMQVLTVLS